MNCPEARLKTSGRWAGPVLLVIGICLVGVFTSHGTFGLDAPTRYLIAKSIADHGDLQFREIPGEPRPLARYERADGKVFLQYPSLGQSLIFVPNYFLWRYLCDIQSDKLIRSLISLSLFPLTLALTALVLFGLLRQFDLPARGCYIAATLLVFATGLWQVSKEAQNDSHLALLYVTIAYCLRRYEKCGALKFLILSAIAAGYCYLIRIDSAIMILCYLAFSLYLVIKNARQNENKAAIAAKHYGCVIAFAVPFLLVNSYINWSHFGNPIAAYNFRAHVFRLGFLPTGLKGLLISPGKGLFLYNPIFLLAIAGLVPFWRKHRAWTIFVLAAFGCSLILFASHTSFHGNWCWGTRYLARDFPLLFLPVAFFGWSAVNMSVLRRAMLILVATLSVFVQIAAVSLHHSRELTDMSIAMGGWSVRQWTMYEPEAHFLELRLTNLRDGIDEMINGRIPPWPVEPTYEMSDQQQSDVPALHYLAFWPYHLTYYMPVVKPPLAAPLWAATLILLGGVAIGISVLVWGYRTCDKWGHYD